MAPLHCWSGWCWMGTLPSHSACSHSLGADRTGASTAWPTWLAGSEIQSSHSEESLKITQQWHMLLWKPQEQFTQNTKRYFPIFTPGAVYWFCVIWRGVQSAWSSIQPNTMAVDGWAFFKNLHLKKSITALSKNNDKETWHNPQSLFCWELRPVEECWQTVSIHSDMIWICRSSMAGNSYQQNSSLPKAVVLRQVSVSLFFTCKLLKFSAPQMNTHLVPLPLFSGEGRQGNCDILETPPSHTETIWIDRLKQR